MELPNITKVFSFEAAHRLTSHEAGRCASIHGHSYKVQVTIGGPVDPDTGMVLNFGKLDFVKEILAEHYDHKLLLNFKDPIAAVLTQDEIPEEIELKFVEGEPTAENIAEDLLNRIQETLVEKWNKGELSFNPSILVTVWETGKCGAQVGSEDD